MTASSVAARSHHGASMPPAMREQPAPTLWPRSITSTAIPRSLNSSAVVRPATPAPTTVTVASLDIGLPFLRRHDPDQVQRVQPQWLSQTGASRTPLGRRPKQTAATGACQAMLHHVRRFLEAIAGVLDTALDRIIPRRRTPTGPVKSAELPPDITAAI